MSKLPSRIDRFCDVGARSLEAIVTGTGYQSDIGETRGCELAPGEDVRLDEQQEWTVNCVLVDECGAREAGNVQLVLMRGGY
jgi:hypothetical protein